MTDPSVREIKKRLTDSGGRMSQDLGLGRILGQILVYLYLSQEECSLDEIGEQLQLSKASVSIASRQLERLGLIVRIWKSGDRKTYYRTADSFMQALQKGFVEFVRQKLHIAGGEIQDAHQLLGNIEVKDDPELEFLSKRVSRALQLQQKVEKIIENPLLKLLSLKNKN